MERTQINKKGLLIFIALMAVVLTVVVISVINNVNPGSKMIKQDENTKEFTSRDLTRVENSVVDILKNNYGYTVDEAKKLKIELRDVKVETIDDAKMLYFLIDIVDLKLTFDASMQSGLDGEYVYLGCPSPEKMLDKNVFCKAYGGESTVNWTLEDKLPFTGLMNDTYPVEIDLFHDGTSSDLDVGVLVCNELKPDVEDVKNYVRKWIKGQTDVNATIYPISVTYFDCEGTEI
jgi:hypothetical protein